MAAWTVAVADCASAFVAARGHLKNIGAAGKRPFDGRLRFPRHFPGFGQPSGSRPRTTFSALTYSRPIRLKVRSLAGADESIWDSDGNPQPLARERHRLRCGSRLRMENGSRDICVNHRQLDECQHTQQANRCRRKASLENMTRVLAPVVRKSNIPQPDRFLRHQGCRSS